MWTPDPADLAQRRARRDGLRAGLATLAVWAFGRAAAAEDTRFPDVLAVRVHPAAGGRFDFDVTVSSPYDTPQRYADAFRVTDLAGRVLGERRLLHDHAGEQPFTRDLYGVPVPPGVARVRVQARDQRHGYGGRWVDVELPGR